jgi:hypothetical protein
MQRRQQNKQRRAEKPARVVGIKFNLGSTPHGRIYSQKSEGKATQIK